MGRTTDNPIDGAKVLAQGNQPPLAVVGRVLHDVLEDTDTTIAELEAAFGPELARLVEALTQDQSISNYRRRNALLRQQIIDAGRAPATVSLADKLTQLRQLHSPPAARKLHDYPETLRVIEQRYGESRLSTQLREQLNRWRGN
jgi:(p)ppGpp synthase/HD superfamily hydrolase